MDVFEALFTRRSIRKFTAEPVSDEDLQLVLKAAMCAPRAHNKQPWHFVVVRDKALMEKVAGTYSEKNPATKCSLGASALIVACAKTNISGCYDGKQVTSIPNYLGKEE